MTAILETGTFNRSSRKGFVRYYQKTFFEAVAGKGEQTPVSFSVPARPSPSTLTFLPVQSSFGEGGVLRPGLFTWDDTLKLFVCTKDIFAITIEMIIKAEWASNTTVGAGVAIGDPASLPNNSGIISAGGTYVSRFSDVQTGRGPGRPNTFKLNYTLVGKAASDPSEIGIFEGDKIFPVLWSFEAGAQAVSIQDIIVSVKNTIV